MSQHRQPGHVQQTYIYTHCGCWDDDGKREVNERLRATDMVREEGCDGREA